MNEPAFSNLSLYKSSETEYVVLKEIVLASEILLAVFGSVMFTARWVIPFDT